MFEVGDVVRVTADVMGLQGCVGVVLSRNESLYGVSIFVNQRWPEWYMNPDELEKVDEQN